MGQGRPLDRRDRFFDFFVKRSITCPRDLRHLCNEVIHYNLDVIISVGYRVKSKRGTQFRQWANQVYRSEGQVFDFFVKRSITSAISAARTREIYSRFFSSLPAPFPAYLDFVALKL